MPTSSTEEDYWVGFCHITKSMLMLRAVSGIKQVSETKTKLIKENPIKHMLLLA